MANAREEEAWTQYANEMAQLERPLINLEKIDDLPYCSGNPKLLKHLMDNQLKDVETVLEIGSGGGHWRSLFLDKNYVGLEQNLHMIELAKRLSDHGSFVNGNAMYLPKYFDKGSFDLVLSSAVLQHNYSYPDKQLILKGINWVLKKNGYLLMIENTYKDDEGDSIKELNGLSFDKKGWKDFVEKYGFQFVDFWKTEHYLFIKK